MKWYWWATIFGGLGLIYIMSKSKPSYVPMSSIGPYTPTVPPKEPDFESGKDVLLNIEQPDGTTTVRA
jgi:hypothetical protein